MANLEQQLHIINADLIKFDKDRKAYTTHYDKLRKTIYDTLKTEEPLNKWLNGHKLGGSYGDGLKITKPDEFDLVFFLKFPENDKIIVKRDPQKPGNVTLDMTALLNIIQNQEQNKATFTSLKKIVNAKNMLLQDKLQAMLSGAFTRALNKMENQVVVNGTSTKLIYKRCGPAHTIFVKEGGMKYSVDFVPSIRLNAKQNVLGYEQLQFFKNVEYWDAIPKPLKPFEPNNISFRASYYEAENIMIRDKQKLKNVIKLMKRFRDTKQNMFNLKSYYIKTLLLWQIKERPLAYWVNKPLSEIYIDMFEELLKCLVTSGRNGKLRFFWDPNLDMFAGFTDNQRRQMFMCVNGEIYNLKGSAGNYSKDTPDRVLSSFCNKLERLSIENKSPNKQEVKPNPKPNASTDQMKKDQPKGNQVKNAQPKGDQTKKNLQANNQPTKKEPAKNQPTKNEPAKNQPTKNEPAKDAPKEAQPVNSCLLS